MKNADWLVSKWMSRQLHTVKPQDPLADAFELMREHRFRHVPVVDKGKLVGIVSDRDVRQALPMRAQLAKGSSAIGKALMDTKIEKVMTKHPLEASSDWTIREASEVLCREKIGALPVVDDGKLTGIITAEDLLWAFVDNLRDAEFEEE